MESNETSTGFGLLLIAKGMERKRQKNAFNCPSFLEETKGK